MKLTLVCNDPPRIRTTTRDVPCHEADTAVSLRVEVRCEAVSAARDDELLRLACAQRLAHLRARLGAVGDICRSALGAKKTSLC
jgi:hypothetical protein